MTEIDQKTTIGTGLPVDFDELSQCPLHIPNARGDVYKTELRVGPRCKINWWHLPDDDRPPHNHPWGFTSTVLHGAITHRAWWIGAQDVVPLGEATVRAGSAYRVERDVYHLVTAVEPGTVTRMDLDESDSPAWGSLDLASGAHVPAVRDAWFVARLHECNRHLGVERAADLGSVRQRLRNGERITRDSWAPGSYVAIAGGDGRWGSALVWDRPVGRPVMHGPDVHQDAVKEFMPECLILFDGAAYHVGWRPSAEDVLATDWRTF